MSIFVQAQKSLGKISVIDHISISKYNPLTGSSYIKLPKELDQEKDWLIFKILMIMNALNGI